MTNLEMLVFGIEHIATNHNADFSVEDLETEGQVCILLNNVPTLADVRSLCEDLGIDRENIYPSSFGIDIEIPYDWYENESKKEYKGFNLWQKGGMPNFSVES